MGKCAILSVLVNTEIPDDCGEQHNRGLNKEISLFLDPCAVQIHHDGVCRFVGIRYVGHEFGMYRIAPVGMFRVIEIYDVERWFCTLVTRLVTVHVVIRNQR